MFQQRLNLLVNSEQECILVGYLLPARYSMGGISLTETPPWHRPLLDRDPLDRDALDRDALDRDPPGQRHPGQRPLLDIDPPGQRPPRQWPPWTVNPLDRDPTGQRHPGQRPLLDIDPLDRDPPGQWPPGQWPLWTETPWTETPGQKPLDRDPRTETPLWTESQTGTTTLPQHLNFRKISMFTNVRNKFWSLVMNGLADVGGFKTCIQICMWLGFPPLMLVWINNIHNNMVVLIWLTRYMTNS